MYFFKIYIAIIALTVYISVIDAKKFKKHMRPAYENEESTPQPKVIPYSTFGFNDVGSYDGFVPSSSDYAEYIDGDNQESTTRLYAPAFPTALEAVDYGNNNYENQPTNEQAFNVDENEGHQSSLLQYSQNIKHFLNPSSKQNDNTITDNQESSGKYEVNTNHPVYGAKLNNRDRYKANLINHTDINTLYNFSASDDKYYSFPEPQTSSNIRTKYGESKFNYDNGPTKFVTYSSTERENFLSPVTESTQNIFNYPRVVDFTKLMQIHYPSSIENFASTTFSTIPNNNLYRNNIGHSNNLPNYFSPGYTDDSDGNKSQMSINIRDINTYDDQRFSHDYPTVRNKNVTSEISSNNVKKSRIKHWIQNKNHTNGLKNWHNESSLNGYDYSTSYVNKPFNIASESSKGTNKTNFDEEVSESSNSINFANYQNRDADFTSFKKMPQLPYNINYNHLIPTSYKQRDYLTPYKHFKDTTPTATSYWGNTFKANDYLLYQDHIKKLPYDDEETDDGIVSITKRPNKYSVYEPNEFKSTDWVYGNQRPYISQLSKDWSNDLFTKYKSEEDLLRLRNHDKLHPSYGPIQKPFHTTISDDEYKNILQKWKYSYLKAKYENSRPGDYDAISTVAQPFHVPIPKPYPIEIPHPVIVPVPQPYPVRIPIVKPVAVPVLRELTLPIEKPVPYPVYKKVPYPIEKPVPVTVEKEVTVPVIKPYPVHVPYIRPVFHHTKYEDSDNVEDDDYLPRPESNKKNVHYKQRPHSSHHRTRRPSRVGYQDRNRRYLLNRNRHSASELDKEYKRPHEEDTHVRRYKYQDQDSERLRDDHRAYMLYCKRKGTC